MKFTKIWMILLAFGFVAFPSQAKAKHNWVRVIGGTASAVVKVVPKKEDGTFYKTKEGNIIMASGFLVSQQGHIVTAHHNLMGEGTVRIIFFDDQWIESKTIYFEEESDIAVIKVSEESIKGIRPLEFGESETVRLGQEVLAMGIPFGYENTATRGIISALHRRLKIKSKIFEDLIQTDAAVNPGNSGGPLVSKNGKVIGMVWTIKSFSGGNTGVSFAISSHQVSFVADQLIRNHEVRRGYIGVRLQAQANDKRRCPECTGAVIKEILAKDSPAADAGIKAGDRIMEYKISGEERKHKVLSPRHLIFLISTTLPDSEVDILLEGKEEPLKVTIGEKPDKEEREKLSSSSPKLTK